MKIQSISLRYSIMRDAGDRGTLGGELLISNYEQKLNDHQG